jgi:putative sigma-54 modulation protein
MQLHITFRQFGSSDSLKEYAKEKVERVNKYLDRAGEAHVVLSLERHLHHAEITIHSGAWVLRGKEKSEDMYASIDAAMDKIESQLRKYKEKIKNHHGRERVHHRQELVNTFKVRHKVFELPETEQAETSAPAPTGAATPAAAAPAASEAPTTRIVRTSEITVKSMPVEEAVMQMNLMNQDFYVFQHATTHEVCVVYRRKDDGQFGLIGVHTPPPAQAA